MQRTITPETPNPSKHPPNTPGELILKYTVLNIYFKFAFICILAIICITLSRLSTSAINILCEDAISQFNTEYGNSRSRTSISLSHYTYIQFGSYVCESSSKQIDYDSTAWEDSQEVGRKLRVQIERSIDALYPICEAILPMVIVAFLIQMLIIWIVGKGEAKYKLIGRVGMSICSAFIIYYSMAFLFGSYYISLLEIDFGQCVRTTLKEEDVLGSSPGMLSPALKAVFFTYIIFWFLAFSIFTSVNENHTNSQKMQVPVAYMKRMYLLFMITYLMFLLLFIIITIVGIIEAKKSKNKTLATKLALLAIFGVLGPTILTIILEGEVAIKNLLNLQKHKRNHRKISKDSKLIRLFCINMTQINPMEEQWMCAPDPKNEHQFVVFRPHSRNIIIYKTDSFTKEEHSIIHTQNFLYLLPSVKFNYEIGRYGKEHEVPQIQNMHTLGGIETYDKNGMFIYDNIGKIYQIGVNIDPNIQSSKKCYVIDLITEMQNALPDIPDSPTFTHMKPFLTSDYLYIITDTCIFRLKIDLHGEEVVEGRREFILPMIEEDDKLEEGKLEEMPSIYSSYDHSLNEEIEKVDVKTNKNMKEISDSINNDIESGNQEIITQKSRTISDLLRKPIPNKQLAPIPPIRKTMSHDSINSNKDESIEAENEIPMSVPDVPDNNNINNIEESKSAQIPTGPTWETLHITNPSSNESYIFNNNTIITPIGNKLIIICEKSIFILSLVSLQLNFLTHLPYQVIFKSSLVDVMLLYLLSENKCGVMCYDLWNNKIKVLKGIKPDICINEDNEVRLDENLVAGASMRKIEIEMKNNDAGVY